MSIWVLVALLGGTAMGLAIGRAEGWLKADDQKKEFMAMLIKETEISHAQGVRHGRNMAAAEALLESFKKQVEGLKP